MARTVSEPYLAPSDGRSVPWKVVARMVRKPAPKIIELSFEKVTELVERADAETFETEHYQTSKSVIQAYHHLLILLKEKNASLRRLQKLLFGASTEKTKDLVGDTGGESPTAPQDVSPPAPDNEPAADASPKKHPGHGRNGADDYPGAEKISVAHHTVQPGDSCPDCQDGTLYEVAQPGVLIRIVGQAPLRATLYQLQKLRCNLCGTVFTAAPPPDAGAQKYDATAGTIIALLKYGSGLPFNRLQKLQHSFGVPVPASTQWEIVQAKAERLRPALDELIRQAAQGEVLYQDDTGVKILQWMGKRAREVAFQEDTAEEAANSMKERTGLFTSGIVSTCAGRRIALFFSGRQHAGENLRDVLRRRAQTLSAPIQMCDPLSRNMPADLQTILANCLAHGRRQFADIADDFRDECRHVLQVLAIVYKNDAETQERQMTSEERLAFHQVHSGPVMTELHAWLKRQLADRLVEPNSGLGQAISYLLRHWQKMTLFLRQAGAPLDNNVCERALKKAILHRKNSLFFKTENGAHVGDLFMSLIYTCELSGANPFDYLTELELHADELAAKPADWMPWNYRATLAPSHRAAG